MSLLSSSSQCLRCSCVFILTVASGSENGIKRRVFKIGGFLNQLLFVIIGDSYVENYGRAARKSIFFFLPELKEVYVVIKTFY